MYSHHELIDFTILVQALFSFCFLISAFSIASNKYAGIVAVLTGLIFCCFTGISHYGISYKPNKILYGAILGASVNLIFVALESAIFWGHFGNCSVYSASPSTPSPSVVLSTAPISEPTVNNRYTRLLNILPRLKMFHHRQLHGAQCTSSSGMKSCSTFSVFLVLSYIFFTILLLRFKNEILGPDSSIKEYLAVPVNEDSQLPTSEETAF